MTHTLRPALKTTFLFWGLGMIGIASLGLERIPEEFFFADGFSWYFFGILGQEVFWLTLACVLGTLWLQRFGEWSSFYRWFAEKKFPTTFAKEQLLWGLGFGVLLGLGILLLDGGVFDNHIRLSSGMILSLQQKNIPCLTMFLYGVFTEEVLLRFGIFCGSIAVLHWVFRVGRGKTSENIIGFCLIASAFIAALYHQNILQEALPYTLNFVLLRTAFVGLVSGLIYAGLLHKKGLETIFWAHGATIALFCVSGKALLFQQMLYEYWGMPVENMLS